MVTVDELIEDFELLGDWEERYRYIIDLGKKLPAMDDADKNDETKVDGCMSNVWVKGGFSGDQPPLFQLSADSDAFIVKGLVALLRKIYVGRTAQEVLEVDATKLFARIGLIEHLSPTRANGLHALIDRIRRMAAEQVAIE
ncbi:MAG: SufE family protein [Gammaproteobacteria bacterium]|nr:SufE family protein [Gammaproteobacteria bacterium]